MTTVAETQRSGESGGVAAESRTRGTNLAGVAVLAAAVALSGGLLAVALSRGGGQQQAVVGWGTSAGAAVDSKANAGPASVSAAIDGAGAEAADAVLVALSAAVDRRSSMLDGEVIERLAGGGAAAATVQPEDEIPRTKRWELYFPEGLTLSEYAQQLDGVGIELGMVVGNGTIEYVTGLSQQMPVRRQGAASDEKRLYLAWTRGDLLAADRSLLTAVGIDATDKVVLQFFPEAVEQKLAEIELAFRNVPATNIFRTRFGIRPNGAAFEFYVIGQAQRK
jgi:hypothetical protein